MELWIDDIRPAPEGYIWVKSVDDAWNIIESIYARDFFEDEPEAIEISLDYDASDEYSKFGGDYIEILNKLEYYAHISADWDQYIKKYFTFHIHSQNAVGKLNMKKICEHNNWNLLS